MKPLPELILYLSSPLERMKFMIKLKTREEPGSDGYRNTCKGSWESPCHCSTRVEFSSTLLVFSPTDDQSRQWVCRKVGTSTKHEGLPNKRSSRAVSTSCEKMGKPEWGIDEINIKILDHSVSPYRQ